jgi:hypothetical protein
LAAVDRAKDQEIVDIVVNCPCGPARQEENILDLLQVRDIDLGPRLATVGCANNRVIDDVKRLAYSVLFIGKRHVENGRFLRDEFPMLPGVAGPTHFPPLVSLFRAIHVHTGDPSM